MHNSFHIVTFVVIFVLGFAAGILSGDLLFDRYVDDGPDYIRVSDYLRDAN